MTQEGVCGQVVDYLATALRRPIAADEDIFASGMVDSLFALELITFLERTFGFEVRSEDLDLANFRTATAMSSLVRTRTHAGEDT